MTWRLFLDCSDTYAPAIVYLIFLFQHRKWTPGVHIIVLYLLVAISIFGYSNWLANRQINNLFLYHIFTLFDFLIFTFFIYRNIEEGSFRKTIKFVGLLFCVYAVFNSLFIEPVSEFNRQASAISCLILSVFSFLYYYGIIGSKFIVDIKRQFPFWVITGLFIYCSTNMLVFLFYKPAILGAFPEIKSFLWIIQDTVLIIKYTLIALGLTWQKKSLA